MSPSPARRSRRAAASGARVPATQVAGTPGRVAPIGRDAESAAQRDASDTIRRLAAGSNNSGTANGPTKIQRFFGSKKPSAGQPVVGSSGKTEIAGGLSAADKAEQKAGYARGADNRAKLSAEIKLLESALKKLIKRRTKGNDADYSAAFLLRDKAQRMLDTMPGPQSRGAMKVLGNPYQSERARLQYIVNEAQLIYDEYRVAMTKKKAGNLYMDAGQRAAARGAPAQQGGLTKLTGGARVLGFDQTADEPTGAAAGTRARAIREHGKDLGLSPAEIAAIVTFTAQDYQYINPATANNDAWMRGANSDLIDKPNLKPHEKEALKASFKEVKLGNARERMGARKQELAERKQEGSLHAGMAMQGFAKMPVWKGLAYRGEVISKDDFDKRFQTIVPEQKYKSKTKTIDRAAIASASKDITVAKAFWMVAWGSVPDPKVRILYELEVTNGRDIEALSASSHEKEVATLPGASFEIKSVSKEGAYFLVKCKQVR